MSPLPPDANPASPLLVNPPENPESNPHPMSLPGRVANTIAAPTEVFDHVRSSPSTPSNWIVPALLLIAVSWACTWLLLSHPNYQQQIREVAMKAVEKRLQKQNLPEAQAEQVRAVAEKWAGAGSKIGGFIAPVFVGFFWPFVWGAVLWLIGTKVLKGGFPFMKAVEANGLINVVGTLDVVTRTLLFIITGNLFATLSPSALVKDYDPENSLHLLLTAFNLITLWMLALRAAALARLGRVGYAKSAVWVFGLWLLVNLSVIGFSAGIRTLVSR